MASVLTVRSTHSKASGGSGRVQPLHKAATGCVAGVRSALMNNPACAGCGEPSRAFYASALPRVGAHRSLTPTPRNATPAATQQPPRPHPKIARNSPPVALPRSVAHGKHNMPWTLGFAFTPRRAHTLAARARARVYAAATRGNPFASHACAWRSPPAHRV